MSHSKQNRREFLEKLTLGVAGASAAALAPPLVAPSAAPPRVRCPIARWAEAGKRFHCWASAAITSAIRSDEQESIRIVRTALDNGVNFLDNCWDYNGGDKRSPDGQGTARRLPPKGIPDDQDRWPVEGSRRPTT